MAVLLLRHHRSSFQVERHTIDAFVDEVMDFVELAVCAMLLWVCQASAGSAWSRGSV